MTDRIEPGPMAPTVIQRSSSSQVTSRCVIALGIVENDNGRFEANIVLVKVVSVLLLVPFKSHGSPRLGENTDLAHACQYICMYRPLYANCGQRSVANLSSRFTGYLHWGISIKITAARASSLTSARPQSRNTDGRRTSCAGSISSVWIVRGVLGPTLQLLCHRARCRAAGRLAHALRLPSQQLL
jgi:hypothetical protein